MTKPFTVEQLRCLELARIIREGIPGVRFDMGTYRLRGEGCTTAGCVAGLACAVYDAPTWQSGSEGGIVRSARKILGLSKQQSDRLFEPWFYSGPQPHDITPAIAAATLTNLGLTGKVEWLKP